MSASVFKKTATGSGPIAASLDVPAGDVYRLISVSCVFDAAPTSSENFTITIDDAQGPQYDVLLYTLDPSAASTTDIFWQPEAELMLVSGDQVDVAFDNTDGNVYGLIFTAKRI